MNSNADKKSHSQSAEICVLTPLTILFSAHPFFDELRRPDLVLPNGRPPPPLFNFLPQELALAHQKSLLHILVPPHAQNQLPHNFQHPVVNTNNSNSNSNNNNNSNTDSNNNNNNNNGRIV
jgi:glycogen synthase kinase 3 beta